MKPFIVPEMIFKRHLSMSSDIRSPGRYQNSSTVNRIESIRVICPLSVFKHPLNLDQNLAQPDWTLWQTGTCQQVRSSTVG